MNPLITQSGIGGVYMVVISKKKGETKDALFRKFSKIFVEENVVDEIRKRQFYKKPSLVKKEKEKERLQRRHIRH